MERPTKTILTPNGRTVELYEYVTGREQRQVQEVFLRNIEVKSATEVSGFKASAASEAQDIAIGIIVRSIDGDATNILNRVLDFPTEDFQAIVEAINEITEPKKK